MALSESTDSVGLGGDETRKGILYGLAAYSMWGVMTVFYKLFDHVSAIEVVGHRVIWGVPFAALLLVAMGRTGDIMPALRSPRVLATLVLSALLISANWLLFVWAIFQERVLETSLAYYINPLITVLIGFLFLGERLSRAQALAIGLAGLAVLVETVSLGTFPWLALALAGTFAAYGYLRKTVQIGPAQGFLVETLLILPAALTAVLFFEASGTGHFLASPGDAVLLILAGILTATPLILFAAGARRLRLSTIGLMQYIAPSIMFLIAVLAFEEPLYASRLVTFVLVWIALAIFTWSALSEDRSTRAVA